MKSFAHSYLSLVSVSQAFNLPERRKSSDLAPGNWVSQKAHFFGDMWGDGEMTMVPQMSNEPSVRAPLDQRSDFLPTALTGIVSSNSEICGRITRPQGRPHMLFLNVNEGRVVPQAEINYESLKCHRHIRRAACKARIGSSFETSAQWRSAESKISFIW